MPMHTTTADLADAIHRALNGREIRPGCVASTWIWSAGGRTRVYCEYRLTSGGASPKARSAGYLDIVVDEDGDVLCDLDHLTAEERAFDRALDETVYAK